MINDCGVIVDAEPYAIFSSLIPASATAVGGDLQYARDRSGLCPDLKITFANEHGPASDQLAELKGLSAGLTWYQAMNRKTVDTRANGLQKEYIDKTKKIALPKKRI